MYIHIFCCTCGLFLYWWDHRVDPIFFLGGQNSYEKFWMFFDSFQLSSDRCPSRYFLWEYRLLFSSHYMDPCSWIKACSNDSQGMEKILMLTITMIVGLWWGAHLSRSGRPRNCTLHLQPLGLPPLHLYSRITVCTVQRQILFYYFFESTFAHYS